MPQPRLEKKGNSLSETHGHPVGWLNYTKDIATVYPLQTMRGSKLVLHDTDIQSVPHSIFFHTASVLNTVDGRMVCDLIEQSSA